MPNNWLNLLFGNGKGNAAVAQNNRDSLFDLLLAPLPPEYQGKVNLAAWCIYTTTLEPIFKIADNEPRAERVEKRN